MLCQYGTATLFYMAFFSSADIAAMEQRYRAAFINSLGGFKSVNLIGTTDLDGNLNLTVFNSIFHIGASPALCGMIVRPDVSERHTLDNIEATGVYTLNHIHEGMYKQAHQSSARYPKMVSEFEATGLTPVFENNFQAPFVGESRVRMALELREKLPLAINGTTLIIGEIVAVYLPDGIQLPDGFVDLEKAGTLACSGLDSYHRTERVARLSYAKPGTTPTEV